MTQPDKLTIEELYNVEQSARRIMDKKPDFPNCSVWADAFGKLKNSFYMEIPKYINTVRENERLQVALERITLCRDKDGDMMIDIANNALQPNKHSGSIGNRVMYDDGTPSREYEEHPTKTSDS